MKSFQVEWEVPFRSCHAQLVLPNNITFARLKQSDMEASELISG